MPTVSCSTDIRGLCSTAVSVAHEKGQEQGLLFDRDDKKYSVLSPNVNDICKYYTLRKLSRTTSDGMVFTLKPEYRKDVKSDENVTTGTWTRCQHRDASTRNSDNKKYVLIVNGVVCRVIFPHDLECDSISRTDEALDQSLDTHSSVDAAVFPHKFEDASVSSASSKLDSTILVCINRDDKMRMNPFIKAEIFTQNSVQWSGSTPARISVNRSNDCGKYTKVINKRKEPSVSISHQTKAVKMEHEERSDTRRRASYAVGNLGGVWTADEEDIVKKKAKFVEKGSCTWSDIAQQIRRVGSARSADACRNKYRRMIERNESRKDAASKRKEPSKRKTSGLKRRAKGSFIYKGSEREDSETIALNNVYSHSIGYCLLKATSWIPKLLSAKLWCDT